MLSMATTIHLFAVTHHLLTQWKCLYHLSVSVCVTADVLGVFVSPLLLLKTHTECQRLMNGSFFTVVR